MKHAWINADKQIKWQKYNHCFLGHLDNHQIWTVVEYGKVERFSSRLSSRSQLHICSYGFACIDNFTNSPFFSSCWQNWKIVINKVLLESTPYRHSSFKMAADEPCIETQNLDISDKRSASITGWLLIRSCQNPSLFLPCAYV